MKQNRNTLLCILPALLRHIIIIIFTYLKICHFLLCFKPNRVLLFVFTAPVCLPLGFTPTSNGCVCSVHGNHGWHVRRAFMALVLFSAYPCHISVQSFDRLFTSGPMHSALAVMHCFGNLASFFLSFRLHIIHCS